MKIVYDFQSFCVGKFNGVSNYFASIIPFVKANGNSIILPFSYCDSVDLASVGLKKFCTTPQFIEKLDKRIGNKLQYNLSKIETEFFLRFRSYDIVHSTQYNPYLFKYTSKPVIITVHDMIHELFKTNIVEIENKRESIYKADKIICISENTKKDLLTIYPDINHEKIKVIYHGYNTRPKKEFSNSFGKYILFVGNRKGYKNFFKFLDAIKDLLVLDPKLNLVCTGNPFDREEMIIFEKYGIAHKVFSRFFKIEEMGSLYKHAACFVYPSLYEGFGLPILDAFHNNCPVCLSNSSCFPEIANDAGLYFDPYSVESIRQSVSKMLYNKSLRTDFVEKGKLRLSFFSWEKSASEHVKLYNSIV